MMCGIFAVINSPNAVEETLLGLQGLEYRGYDSFGISVLTNEGKIQTFRAIGKPSDYNILDLCLPIGSIAIGHTRWATHGEVSIKNTHPIEYGNWVVVHNGIITNHEDFKFVRSTDTDSEAIAYLLSQGLKPNELLKGQLTYIALSPAKLIANGLLAKKEIDNKIIISSFTPFNEKGWFWWCDDFEYKIKDTLVGWYGWVEQGFAIPDYKFPVYDNYQESIYHQDGWYSNKELAEIVNTKVEIPDNTDIRRWNNIVFIGAGSSYNAALFGSYMVNGAKCYNPTDKRIGMEPVGSTFVVLSQSGETKDTIDCLQQYKPKNVIVLTNYPKSTLGQTANHVINLNVGEERAVAATKSFYAQCIALWRLLSEPFDDIRPTKEILEQILTEEKIVADDRFVILGSDLNYVAALEGALKFKELAYSWVEAIPSSEFKHGPLALVDSNFVAILLDKDHPIKSQIEARGGRVIVSPYDGFFENVVWLQKLAINTSLSKGINPDYPRNLAKSITTL